MPPPPSAKSYEAPKRSQRLEDYLSAYVASHQVLPLIRHRGIFVTRQGATHVEVSPDFIVNPGDTVSARQPWPENTIAELARLPSWKFLDLATVPRKGSGTFGNAALKLCSVRPKTKLASVDSLEEIIGLLTRPSEPLGDVLLYTHGWSSGFLAIPARSDPKSRAAITYEDIDAAIANHSWTVPADGLIPSPKEHYGTTRPRIFYLKGCRLGQNPVWLNRFKQALGGQLQVAATKHWLFLLQVDDPTGNPGGHAEYLKYSFGILRARPFANKWEALTEFRTAGFRFIPASPTANPNAGALVPAQVWGSIIPSDPSKVNTVTREFRVWFSGETIKLTLDYTPSVESLDLERIPVSQLGTDPGDDTQRRAALMSWLQQPATSSSSSRPAMYSRYRPTHPFPEWRRWELNSLQELMDRFNFTFDWPATGFVTISARTFFYEVRHPVTDPATRTGMLFANFYPVSSTAPVDESISINDTRLMTLV